MAELCGPGDVFSGDVLKRCNNKYQHVTSITLNWALNTDASVKDGVMTKGDHKRDNY